MQIVIDIPEAFYKTLKKTYVMVSGQRSGKTLMSVIFNAVANGEPLPKGHGRLIDVNKIPIEDDYYVVEDAPTIIEADSEKE